ncbi:2-Keto-3-deoxy-D-manno-octulosonate-8-phosphate synthase [hydrothermal vent metagenome]|uniref:3-deoxy-8-phosphooctulonate synthase n=1 Tax=hydrothermal vent metagenome TaxID=652676 RepID=A0A3B1BT14_9ZZZZ
MSVTIELGDITFDTENPFVFIGGPCVIENYDHALTCAEQIKKITDRLNIPFIFKASYDKANRSSVKSFRGVGMDEGLRTLKKIRDLTGTPVISDIHTPEEATMASEVLDILQIPAFLCRQTDLLVSAGRTGKPVNIKKGQFMAPWDMKTAVEKVQGAGSSPILLTERGTFFGYNRLVVDMTALHEMQKLGPPVVFDAGHSAQLPGGLGSASGGVRDYIPVLARAAIAAKVAGIFLETHPDPDNAPCDGPNMWPINQLEELLTTLKQIDEVV